MTYKQLEAMREVRLWLSQIIVPTFATVMMASPEARTAVTDAVNDFKNKLKRK